MTSYWRSTRGPNPGYGPRSTIQVDGLHLNKVGARPVCMAQTRLPVGGPVRP